MLASSGFSQDANQTGFGDSELFSLDTNSNVSGLYNPDNSGFADSGLFDLDTTDGNQNNSDNNQTKDLKKGSKISF